MTFDIYRLMASFDLEVDLGMRGGGSDSIEIGRREKMAYRLPISLTRFNKVCNNNNQAFISYT